MGGSDDRPGLGGGDRLLCGDEVGDELDDSTAVIMLALII